jgi:uncharacterized protein (PEP-CTERM system associated)
MHWGKLLRVLGGRGCVAIVTLAVTCLQMSGGTARAQTVDYFATPWVVAPSPSQTGNAESTAAPSVTMPAQRSSSYSSLYAQTFAANPPPVLYVFNLGVDEIATDNIAETETARKSDLSSIFSAGTTITAQTARLSGVLAATGFYQRNIVDTDLDQFSEYAYANGQATLVPGNLYFSVGGAIDDLSREGAGVQNPLLQSGQDTHTYTISGSPYLSTRIGDIGLNVLRYQIGQAWFSNNTGQIVIPGQNIGPITASTDQTAREDFKMAGTILARLMSDVSISGTEDDAGNSTSGNFQQANAGLINEYEITRAISLIGAAGYETVHDQEVSAADGQGLDWDIGGRLRPDADSSILLVYGCHDRKTDIAGELEWRLTPFTDIYADYTDTLTDAQQTLISNNSDSLLGPGGAVTDVTFDQSTLIGVLDDATLNAQPGNVSALVPNGIPLATSNNYSPLQNGLFRAKTLSASARSIVDGDPVVLTAYDVKDISLSPLIAPSFATEGGNLSWSPGISPRLSGFALVGYSHLTGAEKGDDYSVAIGATYLLSESISLVMRYDFIRRQAEPSSGGYIQNAVTLGLHKSFD